MPGIAVDKVVSRGRSKKAALGHRPTAQVLADGRTVHLLQLGDGRWVDQFGREYEL